VQHGLRLQNFSSHLSLSAAIRKTGRVCYQVVSLKVRLRVLPAFSVSRIALLLTYKPFLRFKVSMSRKFA